MQALLSDVHHHMRGHAGGLVGWCCGHTATGGVASLAEGDAVLSCPCVPGLQGRAIGAMATQADMASAMVAEGEVAEDAAVIILAPDPAASLKVAPRSSCVVFAYALPWWLQRVEVLRPATCCVGLRPTVSCALPLRRV